MRKESEITGLPPYNVWNGASDIVPSIIAHLVDYCRQVGLSNYNVGIFHLFNHAFFKALLFLTAGRLFSALFCKEKKAGRSFCGGLCADLADGACCSGVVDRVPLLRRHWFKFVVCDMVVEEGNPRKGKQPRGPAATPRVLHR